MKITPPKLIRSRYSTEQIADFSDNGVILAVTSERNATIRTYELIQNGKRTPLTNIANDRPVALSPKGKPFQRPSLMPGRQGGPPVRVGPLGVNAVWSPSVAGSRYLRRYYEDGSYLIAAPMGEGDHLSHKLGRTKDGKFVEELITIKDFQGILERTSDDALWLMSRKPGKPNEKNILLTRYHKMGTRTYPLPDNNTVVNRLGEGNGVIAAGVTNLKAARGEQIITYANGKWTILPLPEGQLSARLTKVFDNGWILGECEGKDQEPTLTVLWKDRTPIILNDLPGWPINGLSSGVMGASRSADIYVRNSIATTFGSDEYYLIHLRE
ncbi:MAG TPA: hypothetical protein VK171_11025 [Fimbriimonas sp.]|nr:hypothetical protein [Fimbriimonas sp.]